MQPSGTIMVQLFLHSLLSMELEMGTQLHMCIEGRQQVRKFYVSLSCTTLYAELSTCLNDCIVAQ